MNYDLELERAIAIIRQRKPRLVCVQLPDGLKPMAKQIQDSLETETHTDVIIWAGSCFGACDIPGGLDKLGVDLLIQWGHSEWV